MTKEQERVLEIMKASIAQILLRRAMKESKNMLAEYFKNQVLKIIDKYRQEGEE